MKITLKNNRTKPYLEALPDIISYQFFTKALLAILPFSTATISLWKKNPHLPL